jgi:hypothetical protein
MADDPLTRFTGMFRSKTPPAPEPQPLPAAPAAVPPPQDGREAYEAFDAKDKAYAHGFDIRCTIRESALSYVVMYNYLHTLAYNRRTWTRIFITVSGLAIEIRGRNLRPIIEAIRMRTCEFIQEYSQDEHILPEPLDPSAPFIGSISVEVIGGQAPANREDS